MDDYKSRAEPLLPFRESSSNVCFRSSVVVITPIKIDGRRDKINWASWMKMVSRSNVVFVEKIQREEGRRKDSS